MKNSPRFLLRTFCLLMASFLALALSPAGHAQIINNIGQPSIGTTSGDQVGASFINGTAASLQNIVISETTLGPRPGEFLTLNARNNDGSPGAVLLNFLAGTTSAGLATFAPAASFVLGANTGYWIVLNSQTSSVVGSWDFTLSDSYTSSNGSSMPATRTSFFNTASIPTTYFDLSDGPQVYRVNGTALPAAVPEAGSSLIYLALALLALLSLPRLRGAS